MKRKAQSFIKLSVAIAVMAFIGALRGIAAPPAAAPEVPPAKSVFIQPSKPSEGRDPFFPDSTRPYEVFAAAHTAVATPTATDLIVNTILVNQRNQAFALINNQTFGVGDEGDVITSAGRRIHITCLSIDPVNQKVTVQFGDVTVTLTHSGD
ncbi:MAG TPA: hypothetical protein VGN23_00325 [Verrucomicrobiae bacterium]|jgi:hypothetical protein